MSEIDERIIKAHNLAERYGLAERDVYYHETGLDADDCFRDLMIYVKSLVSSIAELERDLSNKEIEYTDLWDDALALQARIAELEAEVVKGGIQVEYLNEDELPKPISYKVYSAMYPCSKVDFVRLFPYVTIDGHKRFLIELPEVQE